ncbi:MAG: hypothetical protein FWE82_08230, partial [Defluviitaleaceae bacterium]|nr:hypothetical protein [Defluviitaleaceae bacterium]
AEINRAANDILEDGIGARFYPEKSILCVKGSFEVIMGSHPEIREGNPPWLEPAARDIDGVKKLIRKAEKTDIKKAIPEIWHEKKRKLQDEHGIKLLFSHGPNGPATMACNILGTTNMCIYIMENPDVMDAFFDVMTARYTEFIETAASEDNGFVSREGIWINDDNCCLFPPKVYERFCAPMLARLFEQFAPLPIHTRCHHSDSSMSHLMGILYGLGVNAVNLGPNIHPRAIRETMPKAFIYGQTPPFILRNGTADQINEYVRRNFECIGGDGGYAESLAGVIAESTPLENIRAYMSAVERFTQY